MTIVDAHTHILPQYVDLAIRVMDRCGIGRCITLAWHDGFGAALRDQLAALGRYPGRFALFGNVDFRRLGKPDFAARAVEQMERDVQAGMRGLKVYKALGLEYRHADGSWWRVDDERLDPLWAAAGRLGVPVLIHTADPPAFWQPMDGANFWNGVLYGEYAWWSYYRKGLPSREELLGERNAVIARHPQTVFVAPHVGSNSECLDAAAEDLDAYPNLHYDLSARIPILGLSPRRRAHAREFLLEYHDRVLFGTDSIYDDANVPTGMQAQCLHQPGQTPLAGADPRERYVETSVAFVQSHLDFLMTDRVQADPPFRRSRQGYTIQGLRLPEAVCADILWRNAERLCPAASQPASPTGPRG